MRRPINWVVFCLSLLFLFANLPFSGRRTLQPAAEPFAAEPTVATSLIAAGTVPEFGYIRADGTFVPLIRQAASQPVAEAGVEIFDWTSPRPAPSKMPASF
jgi:hypothetical protein